MSNFENLVEYFSVYLNTFAYVCHVFEYFSTYSAPFFMICHYVLKQSIPEYQVLSVSSSRWGLLNPSQHWVQTSGSMASNLNQGTRTSRTDGIRRLECRVPTSWTKEKPQAKMMLCVDDVDGEAVGHLVEPRLFGLEICVTFTACWHRLLVSC